MKHYPLLDKGVDISGLEPIDFAFVVAIAFVFAFIAWLLIGFYASFIFVIALMVSFVIIRAVKTNKFRGYFARRLAFRWLRRFHKVY